jgi:perosamine synthetase
VNRPRIPVAGPWITQREAEYAADAAANDWYSNAGRYIGRFERAFAEFTGVDHAVSLPHCTAGIHLALAALGIGPGDEIIVPESTWIASVAPVSYVGATPVLVDVAPDSWCLTAKTVERAITPRTKAVIAVDLYGSMPDFRSLRLVTAPAGIPIIEDAAEAVGSTYEGKPAGSLGDVGVFSFHGSKTLTTGEGGMLVTGRKDIYDRVLVLRDHGRQPGDRFFQNTEVAFKYKMAPVQAALGLAQLERVAELVGKKRQIFAWYEARLRDVPGVALNAESPSVRNSYWMVTAVLDTSISLTTLGLMRALDAAAIDSRPFFSPLSSLRPFAGKGSQTTSPVAYSLARCAVNLPSALTLEEADVDYVCRTLRKIVDEARAAMAPRAERSDRA